MNRLDQFAVRGAGRNGRAPKGNQNALKRPGQSVLDTYAAKLSYLSREQIAHELGVAVSTTYRWIPTPRHKASRHQIRFNRD